MKIVVIAYLQGVGGAERQITKLANSLAERSNEVHMIVLSRFVKYYFISPKVIVHDLTMWDKKFFSPIIGRYFALFKSYSSITPDIVIHYNFQSAYLTALIPRHFYKKSIYSERGDPYDSEYSGLLGVVRNWAIKRIDGFVFQSEGARDFFNEKIRKRSIIIHNSVSIPLNKYPIPKNREKRIVSVGRIHPQKNHELLIKAFALVADKIPDFILEIYGDGDLSLKKKLEDLILSLGMENRIYLRHARSDIFDAIYKASLFVLSSDFEGMPNALLEAMALGLPCISTDCRPGGAKSLIINSVNGFIVPCGNTNLLSETILYVLKSNEVSVSISYEARKIAETHTDKYTFDRWNDFLKNI